MRKIAAGGLARMLRVSTIAAGALAVAGLAGAASAADPVHASRVWSLKTVG